jgi:hypothetical protein
MWVETRRVYRVDMNVGSLFNMFGIIFIEL